ncbi:MAG: hypothetical protein DCC71_23630 [Proteobacteria bacterium]|nr:MAG: hypothetical protein DCC71_23630 [Pseudomonadota bacterium]
MSALRRIALLGVALSIACAALATHAEIGAPRVLDGFEIERGATDWEVHVRFHTPVRYLRHAPGRRGDTLEIQIVPIHVSPTDAPVFAYEESLAAPAGAPIPLRAVSYEGLRGAGRFLVLRFTRPVAYGVRPGADFRSIVVSVEAPAARSAQAASEPAAEEPPSAPPPRAQAPALPPADWAAQTDALLAAGRAALERGDADAAIRAFTKLGGFPEHANTPAAKELLGLARERRGHVAHAKAEYQEYLARYPVGEAADRVRQRLDALLTAQAKLPAPRGAGGAAPARRDYDVLGSVYGQYRYEHRDFETGSLVADSSLWSDATFVGRLRTPRWSLRSQASGSQRVQFVDAGSGGGETRVSSLFVEGRYAEDLWRGTVGRQSGNTGGLYSRFDGLRASRRVAEHWRVGVLGGAPVEYYRSNAPDFGRYAYGLSLEADRLFGQLDGTLYAIQQRAGDLLDRSAIGLELRWAHDGRFAAALLDYDVVYGSLNTALLNAHWQIDPKTSATLFLDHRNSPPLSTTNATIGQGTDELSDLEDDFSASELRRLAEDRTARSTIVSVGGTRQLSERLQLALDFSVSHLSGTPDSGGVGATEATGWETSLYPQLVATGLLLPGDVGSVGVRWFDGSASQTWSLILHERLPVTKRLRLHPRLRVDYRTSSGSDEFVLLPDDPDASSPSLLSATRVRTGSLTLRPYLGAEYRLGRFTLDTDCGVEWTTGAFGDQPSNGEELAYILSFGVRYDF